MKPVSRMNTEENQNRSQTQGEGKESQRSGSESSSSSPSIGGVDLGGISKQVSGFAESARNVASDAMSRAQEYGGNAVEGTSSFVRRYPAQTLIAGFGIGVLLGAILARR